MVTIQRWIFCCNNEASMSVHWPYHGWVTHLYHREIKNFSRFSNFWIVPIFWNNMWGQCIIRNFLCFPSFQKLDNLNPEENREKSIILATFIWEKHYCKKTLTLDGWMNMTSLGCPPVGGQNFSWSCQTHFKPNCQRFTPLLYFHHCIWRATFQNNWWCGKNWGNVTVFPKYLFIKKHIKIIFPQAGKERSSECLFLHRVALEVASGSLNML